MLLQRLERIIARRDCHRTRLMGLGTGDIPRRIADDEDPLRSNIVAQEGTRALLGDGHQGIAIAGVTAISADPKIVPDIKRLQLQLRPHGKISRQEAQNDIRP